MVVWLPPHVVWCVHGTPVSTSDILRALGRPLLAATVATALAYLVVTYVGPTQSPTLNLLMACSVMAVAYSCLMIATGKQLYHDLLTSMRDRSAPEYQGNGLASSLSVPRR